jgi:APA family basic amino acid/polyamine antiporter
MSALFLKKDIHRLAADAHDHNAVEEGHGLKRSLSALNLVSLGVGAIIGAGIFSLTGAAAANYAGPGIAYSFVLGGILCALAGLCYAEMAAMIPVAGSAYAYSYATLGELIAWIIGWDLSLEYAFGAVTVSSAWSGYVYSLFHKTFGIDFPDIVVRLTRGPWENVTLANGTETSGLWNLPASFIVVLVTAILYRGMRESAFLNNIIVAVKLVIVVSFIALGIGMVSWANLIADPNATGLAALVPPPEMVNGASHYGWGNGGVLTGAGVVFFAYIGFDAVSTTAQEAKNPARDLPIGILGSLVICTILYILVAVTLTGVVPYRQLAVPDPIAVGIDKIVELRGWSDFARISFTSMVKLGAISGLSSVILVLMLGQTRIFYAMSRDGLLPWFKNVHPIYGTPHTATVVTGVFVALAGGVLPMSVVGELVSIGTLLAFVLVCVGVPILRFTAPDVPRPFKIWGGTPGAVAIGGIGAAACLWVMSGLPTDTWLRLIVWLAIGFGVYFGYGRHHSVTQIEAGNAGK